MKMNFNFNKEAVLYCLVQGIGALLILWLCLHLVGCKTVGTVSEQVNIRDSVAIQWRDSVRWHVRDSLHLVTKYVEQSDSNSLVIQFGQGGGTYNAKTGQATNVAGVQQTDTRHQRADSTAYWQHRAEQMTAVADSLAQRMADYQSDRTEERKPSRSGYDRFCSWWFWVTALLLLIKVAAWIMEKIPATAPYIIIARKFIPFL